MTTAQFKFEVSQELTENILPYWENLMTDPCGGFFGRRDGHNTLVNDAPKGLILNARILWTFSAAYRIFHKENYLSTASRAKNYILDNFIDREFGGAFWSLDSKGNPLDTKKQIYAIAFAIYGLAEFSRATHDGESLDTAISLYRSIEEYSFDRDFNGYIDALSRDWQRMEDMSLSEKDQNAAKTMNTHLHILEAYTCLFRIWKDTELEERLRNLIILFANTITGPDGHLQLFFDEHWRLDGHIQSFGHDIECSWLLWEAACVLGDDAVKERVRPICSRIAEAGMEGFTPEGGMIYEWDIDTGDKHLNRDWWVQAETVVGCFYQWQLTGDEKWHEAAEAEWEYIKKEIIAPDGEWYWGRLANGSVNVEDDRAGFWKCPYHNGRMCMELVELIG